ncbi:MAG: AhpC/TSA family protein [Bacteroidota bacterium]
MKIKTTLLFFLLISSLFVNAQNFKINGTVEGLPNGTWLYLKTVSPDKKLDSTQLSDGKFTLSGKMADKITRVYLHTHNYTNYLSFWLEEKPLTISLKAGEFKKGLIIGSKTELENKQLTKLMAPITKKQDSLSSLLGVEKDAPTKELLLKELNAARKESKQQEMDYVKSNPNSLISANLLDIYSSTWGKEKAAELYKKFNLEMKNTQYGKNINNFLSLNKDVRIGGQFVDFEQANTAGKMIKLSGIKAKYILLEFWGSWCGPCRAENPNLVKTYAAYKNKGFEILGVAADDNKEQWLKAIQDDKLLWENVSDLKGDKNVAALIYGINAYPTNFLIDEKGVIIAKNLRGQDLEKKLAELLP